MEEKTKVISVRFVDEDTTMSIAVAARSNMVTENGFLKIINGSKIIAVFNMDLVKVATVIESPRSVVEALND